MAYTVDNFSNTSSYTVNAGTVNQETHLTLLGKNYFGYGEYVAENFLHLMEHFAGETQPATNKSVAGMLWYKPSEDKFYRYDGSNWNPMPGSSAKIITVQDDIGGSHQITMMYDEDTPVSAFSSESFTVDLSEDIASEFPTIGKGITLNSSSDFKFHGTATTAQYADIAELYKSDQYYEPGTVVKIGGASEVTQTTDLFCSNVFGVISTDPAYLMNSMCAGIAVPVALAGRIPCKVIGQVKKGDRLFASEEPGIARVASEYELQEMNDWYRVIGRALEDKTTEGIGLVEVVVGAK